MGMEGDKFVTAPPCGSREIFCCSGTQQVEETSASLAAFSEEGRNEFGATQQVGPHLWIAKVGFEGDDSG